jgi:hypothetical protein
MAHPAVRRPQKILLDWLEKGSALVVALPGRVPFVARQMKLLPAKGNHRCQNEKAARSVVRARLLPSGERFRGLKI